ncbi:MAG: transposase [Acidimicrobiales bacterium]
MARETPGLVVLADGAYGSGETLAALDKAGHTKAIKPYPGNRAAVPGGFSRDDFTIDHVARTATCPAGQAVGITRAGNADFRRHCKSCALRSRCTTAARGRQLKLAEHDAELVESRRAWRDRDHLEEYRKWRPMVERSISWLVKDHYRRVRFRGVERNQLGLSMRVAAINLRRLVNLGLDFDGKWTLGVT